MEQANTIRSSTADREIGTTRILNAPRELVFKMWTEPEHIAKWWGPNGFRTTIHKMDFRPGGEWIFIMHGPDGVDYPNEVRYIEIVKPERLVYDHGPVPKFHVTVTFSELDGKTKLTMNSLFETAEFRDKVIREHGAVDGMIQTLNRLEELLAKQ